MNYLPGELTKKDNENSKEFILRVCAAKDEFRLTWDDIADICNSELGTCYSESYYRKKSVKWLKEKYEDAAIEAGIDDEDSATPNVLTTSGDLMPEFSFDDEYNANPNAAYEKYRQKVLEYQLNKVRIADERNYNNEILRRLAREDSLKDIAIQTAQIMSAKKILDVPELLTTPTGDKSAILCISDWHYGITIDNIWNKYDPDIARTRIEKLCSETKRLCKEEGVNKLYVVNLADLIAGRIHAQIRIQSRYDVISQEMMIAEILAEFLNLIAGCVEHLNYYDCLDNHSRIEPNKKESLNLESLARFTPWYLKARLQGIDKINIHTDNSFGQDIIAFKVDNFTVGGVHGDKDRPEKVVDNLTLYTKENFDLILTAHLHHFSCDEKNGTLVIANGSLMGTDDYAESLRLNSKPSQNFIVVGKTNVAEEIHRIVLD